MNIALLCFIENNVVAREQASGGTIKFDARLCVGGHGVDESGRCLGEIALAQKYVVAGGGTQGEPLALDLISVLCEITRTTGGVHTGTILLHGELCVADFDANLVLQLERTHLGLAEL